MATIRQHPNEQYSRFRVKIGVMPDFRGSDEVFNEMPDGEINSVNKVFYLENSPLRNTERVFKNGMMMQQGVDYIIDYEEKRITFSDEQVPQENKTNIFVNYTFMRESHL